MGLALPMGLSPSSVSAFKDCPQAFRFSYIDRLPEPPSAPASKGTLVHRALELLMLRDPADRTVDSALADLETARRELADHPEFAGLDLSEAEWSAFHADAELLVRRYFELEDPTTVKPIGLELRLAAPVGRITLRGIIDRLELDADGELVITDYKTGSVPSEMYENTRMAGVHIYAFLCEQMLGRRPAKVQLYFLSKPEAIIARPTEQSVTGVERRTNAVWTAIARACERDDFRPSPGPLCEYCTFKPYCPAYGGDPLQAVELRGPGTAVPVELPLAPAASG
jgi:putative RecB family exonuclease